MKTNYETILDYVRECSNDFEKDLLYIRETLKREPTEDDLHESVRAFTEDNFILHDDEAVLCVINDSPPERFYAAEEIVDNRFDRYGDNKEYQREIVVEILADLLHDELESVWACDQRAQWEASA